MRTDPQDIRDRAAIDELLEQDGLTRWELDAFASMEEWLDENLGKPLSPRQRSAVNRAARRLGTQEVEGPEDETAAVPPSTRLTAGDIPRGKEVEIVCGPRPVRPPRASVMTGAWSKGERDRR